LRLRQSRAEVVPGPKHGPCDAGEFHSFGHGNVKRENPAVADGGYNNDRASPKIRLGDLGFNRKTPI
jgi:hypothetical protein